MIGETISHYRIVRKLGAGGMGEVYLAEDTKLDRKVALKFLLPDSAADPTGTRRFLQEARAAALLHHGNIAHVYEIGEAGGTKFIAMEYVEGETLSARLRGQPLSMSEIVAIAVATAEALEEAHHAGIIHRDIKPSNIMIGRRGQVKVLDFGLAKVMASSTHDVNSNAATLLHTGVGVVLGTVSYMSPEQALGRTVDHRTDLFSLGVVLYEMATGRRPFAGATTTETLDQVLHAQPEPVSRLNPEVSPELERIAMRCLEKAASRRYQSAAELLSDLRNLRRAIEPQSTAGTERGLRGSSVPARRHAVWFLAPLLIGLGVAALWMTTRKDTIDSVAVFPFINASADPEIEYLADGITENLINRLSQMSDIRVLPRASVYRYQGKVIDPRAAGRALGVRSVVVGRVIQRGPRLSVRAELIDVEKESHLWGAHYERDVAELLSVEDEIAFAVAERLQVDLDDSDRTQLARRYTENIEAHQLYLKGRYVWNKRTEEGIRKGIEYFRQAIDADPGYSLAYAGLADCYNFLGAFGIAILPPGEAMPKAKAAAMKALEIDESLAEAHTSLAFVKLYYDWDWSGAEREFLRAIALRPDYAAAHQWYSHLLGARNRSRESIASANRAVELDPLSLAANLNLGWQYHWSRQPELAVQHLQKTLEMEPAFEQGHWGLGLAYEQKGMYREAAAEFRTAAKLSPGNPVHLALLGYTYAKSGNAEGAAKLRTELEQQSDHIYVPPYWMATLAAGQGDREGAFRWLEMAHQERSGGLVWLAVDPRMDALRSDRRFAALLERVGVEP